MRDFCNVAERDCIRLIVAQDLKENGIDLDSQHSQQQQKHQKDHTINKSNISTTHDSDNDNRRVFGLPLRNLEMIQVKLNDQLLSIPIFLKYAIDHISQYIHVEGIFRRNGTATRLRELKKQVEEGQFNFAQFTIFDVTSLVKLFFRELPESLLSFALYNCFIQAIKLDSSKAKFTILNLCLQLPDINLHVLIYLMTFLKAISLHEEENKMNSFNLAVCYAPNIIYTRINKINELYINEERMVIQFLIENSSLIGKISDSVYERSLMLTSLCCSDSKDFDAEQESFATARSTSLSSYCNNKKEKKKRRSSSLKELMTTIQNSISKFRRRSASEKNDKTTCSIMSTDTSTRMIHDDKSQIQATPYKILTPISSNIYTPRIKRNAEESLQSTTKKKLLDKLPQRNLLPNAPVTPFSTSKKNNKHAFKLLGTAKPFKFENIFSPDIRFTENKEAKFNANNNNGNTVPSISLVSSSISCVPTLINCVSTPAPQNCILSGGGSSIMNATPLNVVNLQKQLKYDDSPSALFAAAASASINPIYDSNIKNKSQHLNDKNLTIASGEILDCRRRLEMTNNIDNNSKYGNYNHYHNHHHSHSHHYYNTSSHSTHHHLGSNSNRYINQSDICATNLNNLTSNELMCKSENNKLSATTTCTSQLNSSDHLQRTLTDSMRCTLKRGRPNTAKTGLSSEYRNRKSSVNTTPEFHGNKELVDNCNNKIVTNMDTDNLNNAIIQIDDDEMNNNKESDIMNNPLYSNLDDLNDEHCNLDDAIVGGDDDIDDDDDEEDEDLDDDFNEKSRDTVRIDGIEPINTSSNDIKNEENDECGGGNRSVLSALPTFPSSSKQMFFDPSLVKFDKFQMNLKQGDSDLLRRQSLFKLKEKMNGRVSKQINEIEKRKLSPYRFSNSPLKRASTLHKTSPVRVPTVICKSLLKGSNLHEHFKFKKLNNTTPADSNSNSIYTASTLNSSNFEVKLPTDSPLLHKAANEFNKRKLSRNKSVKRLKITNTNASPLHQTTTTLSTSTNKSFNGSPISKNLMQSTQLNCASESFDF